MPVSPEDPPPPENVTPSGGASEKAPGTPLEDVSHHPPLSDQDREAALSG